MAGDADFVIVGAGTAGCVLASRLSDNGVTKVTLIEAGAPPTSPAVTIPAAFAQLFKTDHDWNFATTPQTAAGGRVVYTPRGKMLGGSSNMNAQVHQWCHPADFDEGAWISQLAHKDGRRFSTYQAYLEPALARPNLTTVPNAHAAIHLARELAALPPFSDEIEREVVPGPAIVGTKTCSNVPTRICRRCTTLPAHAAWDPTRPPW